MNLFKIKFNGNRYKIVLEILSIVNGKLNSMECKFEIWLIPHSAKRRIEFDERGIRVYVNSPPVDGRANEECCALFSEKLGIPKSMVSIERGTKGRKKIILIKGMTHEKVLQLLRKINEK